MAHEQILQRDKTEIMLKPYTDDLFTMAIYIIKIGHVIINKDEGGKVKL